MPLAIVRRLRDSARRAEHLNGRLWTEPETPALVADLDDARNRFDQARRILRDRYELNVPVRLADVEEFAADALTRDV